MIKKVLYLLVITAISMQLLYSQTEKDDIYKALSAKYGNLKTINLFFKSAEDGKVQGSLTAKKGNKYIIKAQNRVITCNGKTIWNYTPKDNKVVLSSYESGQGNELSIETFFFNFIKEFKPVSLTKERNSKGIVVYVLTLEPDKSKSSLNIKKVKIWVEEAKNTITKVQSIDDQGTNTYIISKIFTNKNIPDKTFDFKNPKDVNVIDLR